MSREHDAKHPNDPFEEYRARTELNIKRMRDENRLTPNIRRNIKDQAPKPLSQVLQLAKSQTRRPLQQIETNIRRPDPRKKYKYSIPEKDNGFFCDSGSVQCGEIKGGSPSTRTLTSITPSRNTAQTPKGSAPLSEVLSNLDTSRFVTIQRDSVHSRYSDVQNAFKDLAPSNHFVQLIDKFKYSRYDYTTAELIGEEIMEAEKVGVLMYFVRFKNYKAMLATLDTRIQLKAGDFVHLGEKSSSMTFGGELLGVYYQWKKRRE